MENKNYISVFFDDEKPLLGAVKKLLESNEKIIDVLTPFPVHGLDKALSMKRSRIPLIGFIFGALGGLLGFIFQAWVFTIDYPLVFGGKPFLSVPSFIPVTFECTILFAAVSMVAAFLIKSRLKPDKEFEPIDEGITDDRFVILVGGSGDTGATREKIKNILAGIQNIEIK
jgi:hypothetical protein